MMEQSRRLEILECLRSTNCHCGSPKKSMQSHCSNCYFKLPKELRSSLYQPFGSGYEEAFEKSLKVLAGKFVLGSMKCGDGYAKAVWPSWKCTRCNTEFFNDGSYPGKCPSCLTNGGAAMDP